jgi:hypothetical protein
MFANVRMLIYERVITVSNCRLFKKKKKNLKFTFPNVSLDETLSHDSFTNVLSHDMLVMGLIY